MLLTTRHAPRPTPHAPPRLVYCLFRFRHNHVMISTLLEKLECHAQPAKLSAFTLHLCYLMLLEPLAAPVEFFLLQKCKSSLHHALQVYWFLGLELGLG